MTPILPVWAAPSSQAQPTTQTLPILQVTPADGATVVRPDATIQFVLDPSAQGYNQFVKQYQQGKYTITLNGQPVQGTLDTTTNTITLTNPVLNRYTTYTVLLADTGSTSTGNGKGNGGSKKGGGGGSTSSSYTFSFTTGSDLHEATHLTAAVEQPSVLVTAGGKLDVQVTDDYGLPANNATVQVTGSSSTFTAPVFNLTSTGNGTGVINLTDHVKELVNLTVTATDDTYTDAVDTQTATGSEQFLAGAPDHLSITANSPLTVGLGEQVTGIVYDVYNNPVEDTTTVSASTTAGLLAPQTENTTNGSYAFTFTAPTLVQDVVLTAQSGTASGQVTVHLQPDQPANVTLTPDTATVKAGDTDNVQLLVTDQYGNPVPNTPFTVTGTGNSQVSTSVTTDSTGHATIPFSDTTAESVTITAASANGVQGTAQVTVQAADPANITLTPATSTLKAGGTENLQAVVTDQYGNLVTNTTLTVTGTGNSQVPATVTTDNLGTATIQVTDQKAEPVTVTATTTNGIQATAQINVQAMLQAGDPVNLTLTPDSQTVAAGSTDNVQVLLTDQYGNPIPNTQLTVSTTGNGQVPSTVTTDSTGHATIPFSDTTAEVVSVTATTAFGGQGSTQLTVQTGAPAHVTVSADQTVITTDGTTTANATVVVTDAYGNPVPNVALTLSSTSHAQFPANLTTGSNGQAAFNVTDSVAEAIAITVTTSNNMSATLNLQSQNPSPSPSPGPSPNPGTMTSLIPAMTSDTSPLGIASASGVYSSTINDLAFNVFDAPTSTSPNSCWLSNTSTGWVAYDFQEPTVVEKYSISASGNDNASPKDWTFEAWNGSQWVVLDTQTNITNWTYTVPIITDEFTISNTAAYTKYRINVTADNGGPNVQITNLSMDGYYATPFTPNGLSNPQNGDSQVTLSWQPGNGVTGYNVYQDGVKVNSTPITSTSYTITGLVNDTVYHYTITAVNASGESLQTAPILAMPFATDRIPVMTSNTSPSGIASASTEYTYYSSTSSAFNAFDNLSNTVWMPTTNTGWLAYDFQKPTVVQEYTISAWANNGTSPKDWTFEGWDGSQWVVLDTQTNITNWSHLNTTNAITDYFTIANTTAYTKYRLNVTADNGSSYLQIENLAMAGSQN